MEEFTTQGLGNSPVYVYSGVSSEGTSRINFVLGRGWNIVLEQIKVLS